VSDGGSRAEDMMMSGVEVGEIGDGGHPGCVIDGESGGDGSRSSV
jgi:hypothetical protein